MNIRDLGFKVKQVMDSETASYDKFMAAAEGHPIKMRSGDIVLYIEDDPDTVSMFKTMLACYSTLRLLTAFTVAAGKELLERKSGRVKCVVMDLDLGLADGGVAGGEDLLSWLEAEHPDVPVVVFTGHAELVTELNRVHPLAEVIVKASDMQNLVRVIETKMQGVA